MNYFKEFAVPALVLTIICLVVSTALVASNNLTAPMIEKTNLEQANAARAEVYPAASEFEKIEANLTEEGAEVYKASDNSGVVITTQTQGYGGDYVVMAGIDKDGKITGVKVTSNSETPGLGTKTTVPEYLEKYVSKASKDEISGVDNVAGATISSTALKTCLNTAMDIFDTVKGELE
ncbi:FMN-binding protein [Candidatus Soleaferrea massiliensis]|uniref:FMN-binding protein n=1 Tax=Candidatus Soleaferrea massiliensis TaxID=1470354 RepID=UPI00058B7C3C|nr:FMN-binding protein [Candidatus Soleaferrea massiliensis]